MLGRVKLRLLKWLFDDICWRSSCDTCEVAKANITDPHCPCGAGFIYKQARKIWGLEASYQDRTTGF